MCVKDIAVIQLSLVQAAAHKPTLAKRKPYLVLSTTQLCIHVMEEVPSNVSGVR